MKGWKDRMHQYFAPDKISKNLRDLQKSMEILQGIKETLQNPEVSVPSVIF